MLMKASATRTLWLVVAGHPVASNLGAVGNRTESATCSASPFVNRACYTHLPLAR
jgi:hypothetical protein